MKTRMSPMNDLYMFKYNYTNVTMFMSPNREMVLNLQSIFGEAIDYT